MTQEQAAFEAAWKLNVGDELAGMRITAKVMGPPRVIFLDDRGDTSKGITEPGSGDD